MANIDKIDLTKRLPRGAIPSPRHELAAATPHILDPRISAPACFLMWPVQMSSWNNYVYGDCVSAEEAFAKATAAPQTFIPEATVVAWATAHGVLGGASLTGVMTAMQTDGFPLNNTKYNDGPYNSVNWTNAAILQSAISSCGPVKIGVGADNFQSNANGLVTPGTSGWAMYNYPKNLAEDHCVSLCGYGTLAELVALFKQNNVTVSVPNGMPTGLCYAMFSWNSIGIIDEQSMLNMTYEAWIRNPVTVVPPANWNGWENLSGIITSGPTAASWAANRLDCFARGQNNAMWHKWWDGNAWSGWEDLGGIITSEPAAVSWGPNRIDCFARGQNNAMWHKWWDGNAWSGWEDLGGIITSGPTAASWAANRLDCFARGQNNAMWHKWWDGNAWSGWEDLGGIITSEPAAVSWGPNRIDCFARGLNNAMWHKWWDGNAWSGWEDLGGIITSGPTAASWAANRLDCFARGQNNAMWHKWWDGKAWSNWEDLGGIITSEPAAVSWGPNRIDCFAQGQDNALWHKWYQG